MNYNKLNLTLTAIFLITLVFTIPLYNHWLFTTVLNPNAKVVDQVRHLDVGERMNDRFGYSYLTYMAGMKSAEQQKDNHPIFLLPPNDYLKANGIAQFKSAEPSEFYYFTDYEGVWANSPHAEQATWAFAVQNHKVVVGKLKNKEELDTLLALYRNYKMTL